MPLQQADWSEERERLQQQVATQRQRGLERCARLEEQLAALRTQTDTEHATAQEAKVRDGMTVCAWICGLFYFLSVSVCVSVSVFVHVSVSVCVSVYERERESLSCCSVLCCLSACVCVCVCLCYSMTPHILSFL